jgi:hypothetical protein
VSGNGQFVATFPKGMPFAGKAHVHHPDLVEPALPKESHDPRSRLVSPNRARACVELQSILFALQIVEKLLGLDHLQYSSVQG